MNSREKLRLGAPLHFDPSAPEADRIVEAAWIEDAIGLHARVDLEHAVVRGSLNVKYGCIDKEFRLASCTIKDPADFSYATFKAVADFSGSIFELAPDFRHSIFEYELFLERVRFLSGIVRCAHLKVTGNLEAQSAVFGDDVEADFDRLIACAHVVFTEAVFGGDVHFTGAHVIDSAYFYGAVFKKEVTFEFAKVDRHFLFSSNPDRNLHGAVFSGDSNFVALQVGGVADFRGATFQGEARFFWTKVVGTTFFGRDETEGMPAAEFRGEADFREADLAQTDFDEVRFGKRLRFSGARLGGSASFKQASFEGPTEFDGVRATDEIDFLEAKFTARNANATFEKSVWSRNARFSNALFEGNAVFRAITIEGVAKFDKAEFKAPATFKDADFLSSADFSGASFAESHAVEFDGTRFRRGAYFNKAKFRGDAGFEAAEFNTEANFGGVIFENKANFEAAHFFGMARFKGETAGLGTIFHQVSFVHATFDRDACFDDAIFKSGASFRETDFRVAYFAETGTVDGQRQFQATVDLTGCTYRRIHVHWRSLLTSLHAYEELKNKSYDRQPYSQLEKVFREVGEDRDADEVYRERRRMEGDRLTVRHDKVRWLLDRIYRWGANYGVRPIRLAVFAVVLIGLGAAVFRYPQAVHAKANAVCAIAGDNRLTTTDSIRFSVRTFLPVDIPLLPGCEATENGRLGLTYSDGATLLRLAGWILVPIGVASLAGLLRRAAP
jgi:uncharacterized protein YjbI with pentapeptide repeats